MENRVALATCSSDTLRRSRSSRRSRPIRSCESAPISTTGAPFPLCTRDTGNGASFQRFDSLRGTSACAPKPQTRRQGGVPASQGSKERRACTAASRVPQGRDPQASRRPTARRRQAGKGRSGDPIRPGLCSLQHRLEPALRARPVRRRRLAYGGVDQSGRRFGGRWWLAQAGWISCTMRSPGHRRAFPCLPTHPATGPPTY